jgi:hypothetical protein
MKYYAGDKEHSSKLGHTLCLLLGDSGGYSNGAEVKKAKKKSYIWMVFVHI